MNEGKRKHHGQVFTPIKVARLVLDTAGYSGEAVLKRHSIDNSCGDGVFICEMIRRYTKAYKTRYGGLQGLENDLSEYIHGIELDKTAYDACLMNVKRTLASLGLCDIHMDIINTNALTVTSYDGTMDFVVGNPPYVRIHNLNENYDTVREFKFAQAGMCDLYIVFFEIGLRMLNDSGRLCYITPSTWINSIYGRAMRDFIAKEKIMSEIIDLEHHQVFTATTYTMITCLDKKHDSDTFRYYRYDPDSVSGIYVCDIKTSNAIIDGILYLGDNETLSTLQAIYDTPVEPKAIVKNGFATLDDDIFIKKSFTFSDFVIPVIKCSTGKPLKAIFPYDRDGNPIDKDTLFSNPSLALYYNANKKRLLRGHTEEENPDWHLYGRSQAINDVYKDKYSINTIVKGIKSIKLNKASSGTGVYSGLYILTDEPIESISSIIVTDEFLKYVASLKKYKNSGFFTYSTKDLERYINYKLAMKKGGD